MEITDVLIGIGTGVVLALSFLGLYVVYLYFKIKNRIDHLIREVVAEAEADLIGIYIELDKGIYFCYNNYDRQFICQGTTVTEIRKAFQERFPGKTAYLAGGDPDVVETFKTELIKLKTNENSPGQ
jgi:hypothetical protein